MINLRHPSAVSILWKADFFFALGSIVFFATGFLLTLFFTATRFCVEVLRAVELFIALFAVLPVVFLAVGLFVVVAAAFFTVVPLDLLTFLVRAIIVCSLYGYNTPLNSFYLYFSTTVNK